MVCFAVLLFNKGVCFAFLPYRNSTTLAYGILSGFVVVVAVVLVAVAACVSDGCGAIDLDLDADDALLLDGQVPTATAATLPPTLPHHC